MGDLFSLISCIFDTICVLGEFFEQLCGKRYDTNDCASFFGYDERMQRWKVG
jgi:hypothetical protein